MLSPAAAELVFAVFAFVFGAVVGSFLNVCIYRLPRDLSVNEPRRSFCPSCKTQIPWHQNLPLASWLLLRGRCAACGISISFRYFVVELLTACLFLVCWLVFPPLVAMAFWVFLALLVVATFIDAEFYIIPNSITWGTVAAGLALSLVLPAVHHETLWWRGGGQSLVGAAVGYFGLWTVVELGKLAFGKQTLVYQHPRPFHFEKEKEEWWFVVGEDRWAWSETFQRKKDQLVIECQTLTLGGKKLGGNRVLARYDRVEAGGQSVKEPQLIKLKGTTTRLIVPREAMGLGDVKLLAGIGAFVGWQGVIFTVFSSSLIGAVAGILFMTLNRAGWGARLPFGPYLSLGAVLWIFGGKTWWEWYLALMQQPL